MLRVRKYAALAGLLCVAPATAQTVDTTALQGNADKLIQAALRDQAGLDRLEYLCYRIGNRLSGSKTLETAVSWAEAEMRRIGLDNVRRVPTKVPHWVRGKESASLVLPAERPLHMLGLGGSVATPKGGITADVVVVSNFDELDKMGKTAVSGKIVVYDVPFVSYGQTVPYRGSGASRAAKLGAVAALVRSVTPRSLRDPHTGGMRYADDAPKIPTAAISVEDAMWLHGLARMGEKLRVHLEMEAHTEPDADSANVMGELRGRELPDEVVVIGGHLDSWDVGQGAHDDGAGVVAALQALALMKQLGIQPRRTIRVVFWVNEENGGRGGQAYRQWVGEEIGHQYAAIEMDGGAERPVGFDLASALSQRRSPASGAQPPRMPPLFEARVRAIGHMLKGIGADRVERGEAEADIQPLVASGVPGLGLRTVGEHYFDYHHTEADTFDKIVPDDFRKCLAAMAVMSYGLAELN